MADKSPLAGLLDRAGHVFSLASQLGRTFHDEHNPQGSRHRIPDATAWGRHRPAFNKYCNALLDLSEPMQHPPAGFAPVAQALLKAAQVAKQIRDVMKTSQGQTFQEFLEFWPHLNSVAEEGRLAVSAVIKAGRPDDPFAFLEQQGMSQAGIDTTPTVPKPPPGLIAEATRAIPVILANIPPDHEKTIELVAAHLAKRLQDAKHSLAAAHWAIHEAVRAGYLRADLVEVNTPTVGERNMGWSGPAFHFHGGQKGTMVIPKGKPAPFDCFKVVATEALWERWRSLEAPEQREDRAPEGNAENTREVALALIRPADQPLDLSSSKITDPLEALEQIVNSLVACVGPLRSLYFKSYGAAEEGWRQAVLVANRNLPTATGLVRRWFSTNLPPTFHLPAEQELSGAEDAINQFVSCPIPQPALPIGWHEDENGKLHTPVGGSDMAHREACERQAHVARLALQAVTRLRRWRNWEMSRINGDPKVNANVVPIPKDKRSSARGEGRAKLIASLSKHHRYAEGGCLNQEPIKNNELARVAKVDKATASDFFKKEFGGHTTYKVLCRDAARLAASLKHLNGEFTAHELFGRTPPGEVSRDE